MMQPPTSRPQGFQIESGLYATSTAATPAQPISELDTELSDILNTVIDIAPDFSNGLILGIQEPLSVATPIQPQQQQDINEKMAINAITKSLMQFESTGAFNNSPPAYSMHNIVSQSNQQVNYIFSIKQMTNPILIH